ncbi:hypothetical protein ACLOJK_025053 [Asimina triloba]
MDIRVIHQFREGNQAADFLAKQGELGSNVVYEDLQLLSRFLRGLIRIDKAELPSIPIYARCVHAGSSAMWYVLIGGLTRDAIGKAAVAAANHVDKILSRIRCKSKQAGREKMLSACLPPSSTFQLATCILPRVIT